MSEELKQQTFELIDDIKKAIHNLGDSGGPRELDWITHIFLYKFLNDKFIFELKKIINENEEIFKSLNIDTTSKDFVKKLNSLQTSEYEKFYNFLPPSVPKLAVDHLLVNLYEKINKEDFIEEIDRVFREIGNLNKEIFSITTSGGKKISQFNISFRNSLSDVDEEKHNGFVQALINPLIKINFEETFSYGFDFFSDIYEYLIEDYNKDGGGKYAEYFTPNSVSKVIAEILVDTTVSNVECYDPSSGTGTLLMSLANQIGTDKSIIYAQDLQRKSTKLMSFNLILNNLVHSINNIAQGNTLSEPFFVDQNEIKKFDYIVSNPPFKLDFSDITNILKSELNGDRFFAGIPKTPPKNKDGMAIFLLFIQHIIYSLKTSGKAAIVVPTGFLSNKESIELSIKKYLIKNNFLDGVVQMPKNIFAKTGTLVSIIFINKDKKDSNVRMINAESFGVIEKFKVDNKTVEKTRLTKEDSESIVSLYKSDKTIKEKSISVSIDDIEKTNFHFSPLVYLPVNSDHKTLTKDEVEDFIENSLENLNNLINESKQLDEELISMIKNLNNNA